MWGDEEVGGGAVVQADMLWVKEGQAEDAKRMMEAQTALDEMRASLRQEMILKLDFNFTCYKHVRALASLCTSLVHKIQQHADFLPMETVLLNLSRASEE